MAELFPITLNEQIKAVEREVEMRERNYPRWVAAKKMTHAKMDKELDAMKAVRATLYRLANQEESLPCQPNTTASTAAPMSMPSPSPPRPRTVDV
jgi:hypothetical protein